MAVESSRTQPLQRLPFRLLRYKALSVPLPTMSTRSTFHDAPEMRPSRLPLRLVQAGVHVPPVNIRCVTDRSVLRAKA